MDLALGATGGHLKELLLGKLKLPIAVILLCMVYFGYHDLREGKNLNTKARGLVSMIGAPCLLALCFHLARRIDSD